MGSGENRPMTHPLQACQATSPTWQDIAVVALHSNFPNACIEITRNGSDTALYMTAKVAVINPFDEVRGRQQ